MGHWRYRNHALCSKIQDAAVEAISTQTVLIIQLKSIIDEYTQRIGRNKTKLNEQGTVPEDTTSEKGRT